ncbi:MAG TPA: hypothetical protein VIE67_04675 [Rudaea sp.]|jgi:hypothetical protein|uniref:hypothetical protein n=1 Tax=Rudaea sp. TaxID=2136325 RepID=UPI002F91E733
MPTKISYLSLGFAAILLAACGNSSPPPPKAKPAAAPVAKVATRPEVAPADTATVNPPQDPPFEGYVGVAPPGKVAFGPAPLDRDSAYQEELKSRMEAEAKQKQSSKPQTPANQDASQH